MSGLPSPTSRDARAATDLSKALALSRFQIRTAPVEAPFVFTADGVRALETQVHSVLRSYLREGRPDGDPEVLSRVQGALERAIHRAFVQERLQAPGDLHAQQLEEIVKLRVLVESMSQRLCDREQEIVKLRAREGPAGETEVGQDPEVRHEAGPEKAAALAQVFEDNLKLRAQFAQPT